MEKETIFVLLDVIDKMTLLIDRIMEEFVWWCLYSTREIKERILYHLPVEPKFITKNDLKSKQSFPVYIAIDPWQKWWDKTVRTKFKKINWKIYIIYHKITEPKLIPWKLKWKQFTPNIEPLNISIDFWPNVVEPNTIIMTRKINEIINHLYTK